MTKTQEIAKANALHRVRVQDFSERYLFEDKDARTFVRDAHAKYKKWYKVVYRTNCPLSVQAFGRYLPRHMVRGLSHIGGRCGTVLYGVTCGY